MGEPYKAASPSGDIVSKKTRRQKKSKSRVPPDDAGRDNRSASLGAGLDEIGFKPLGRRIIVAQRAVRHENPATGTPSDRTAVRSVVEVTPADDSLGYDTSDPDYSRKVAKHALSGADKGLILKEVDADLRRWKLRD